MSDGERIGYYVFRKDGPISSALCESLSVLGWTLKAEIYLTKFKKNGAPREADIYMLDSEKERLTAKIDKLTPGYVVLEVHTNNGTALPKNVQDLAHALGAERRFSSKESLEEFLKVA